MRLRPAALILRFFGAGAGFGTASAFFISAQRFRCAAAIRFRAAALIVRFFGVAAPESTAADFRAACPAPFLQSGIESISRT